MEPQGDALNWEAGERANDFAVCNVNVGFWHLGITVRISRVRNEDATQREEEN